MRFVSTDVLQLEQLVNTPERNALAVRAYTSLAAGRQAVAFCAGVQVQWEYPNRGSGKISSYNESFWACRGCQKRKVCMQGRPCSAPAPARLTIGSVCCPNPHPPALAGCLPRSMRWTWQRRLRRPASAAPQCTAGSQPLIGRTGCGGSSAGRSRYSLGAAVALLALSSCARSPLLQGTQAKFWAAVLCP